MELNPGNLSFISVTFALNFASSIYKDLPDWLLKKSISQLEPIKNQISVVEDTNIKSNLERKTTELVKPPKLFNISASILRFIAFLFSLSSLSILYTGINMKYWSIILLGPPLAYVIIFVIYFLYCRFSLFKKYKKLVDDIIDLQKPPSDDIKEATISPKNKAKVKPIAIAK